MATRWERNKNTKNFLLEKLLKISEKYLGKEETEKIVKEATDEFVKEVLKAVNSEDEH